MKPWIPSIITAVALVVVGGGFSYLDAQQHGDFQVDTLFRPKLPEEGLGVDTSSNEVYVPRIATDEEEGVNEESSPTEVVPEDTAPLEDVPEVTPPRGVPGNVPESEETPTTPARSPVEELFTQGGVSDIVIRQNRGETNKLFDVITVPDSLGTFLAWEVEVFEGVVQVYLRSDATSVQMQDLLNAARLQYPSQVQVARLPDPYGDEFAYINLENASDTVFAVMLLGDQLIGFEYPRTFHSTFYTFLNAL